jgi:lipid-binding SYLF domain-containing protein
MKHLLRIFALVPLLIGSAAAARANATMGQVSLGFQPGGKAYSQIIFFEDKRALDEFESGNFEFGADASVVAVTAGANAGAATNGASSAD